MSLLRRGAARVAALILSLCAALALAFAGAAPASADPPHGHGDHHAMGWYLALGDSLAAGYQPGLGEARHGGYTGKVLRDLRRESGKTTLRNLSCSGESTVTMAQGGICSYHKGTQLAQAVQFLHAHAGHTRLVTVTIGANDVQRCVRGAIDVACVEQGMADIRQDLPVILGQLRAAAPRTEIVVTNYDNPFLAAWLLGPDGQALARMSDGLLLQLNGIIAASAAGVHAGVADVATAFSSRDFTDQVTLPGIGEVPLNVARICQWTWMCTLQDIHTNDLGYAVIGHTVIAVLEERGLAADPRLALVG
ncbi:MAG TPA: SGNH/GDSL hydrolase family protein [Segeticoccus sp.]|uniref:SGNH/GDSL hydrolase family protein n=1 Tax=Segeticoccus sp. TaxID=2706531 RepID=UPI002D7F0D82|nr:SGNH/GDSL hydrolase family protein [Segeticoccus sp.]HET8600106.1 SGNH/GDSL hydrolase family protein [Segeticoccus sp.]